MASLQQNLDSKQLGPQLGSNRLPAGKQHRCPWQVWPEPEGHGQVAEQAGRAGHAGAQVPFVPRPLAPSQLPERHWASLVHFLPSGLGVSSCAVARCRR
jgi:hypothetical protein